MLVTMLVVQMAAERAVHSAAGRAVAMAYEKAALMENRRAVVKAESKVGSWDASMVA